MMRVLCAWFLTMLFACAALAAPKAAETGQWSCYDGLRFVKAAQKLAPAVVEQLKAGQFQAIVAELRSATAAGPQKAELRYEALRLALEEDPKLAAGLCDFLARDSSLESATMRAETLLLAATAVVAGGQYSPKISGLNDALAGRAASLLDHSDPFVRGIAEWAIAVRVNRENDGSKMAWPRRNPPAWFTRWQAVEAKNLLNYDYVRQAVQQNMHRTVADLRASGDQVVARAEKLATAISAAKGLAEVKAAHGRLAAAADLSSARLRWLELRHAARELVLASPDLAFQQLVFCKRRNHLGQHNIANYAFHQARMPAGGDVLIKRGFDPATPAESLLRGRLGEGNIRGMDLFYDADRLVFAFSPWPDPNDPKTAKPTHLYEMKVDGSGLRQLTDDPLFIDCEPAYLPNGDVVFASDRGRVGSECGPWDQNATVLNLYRVSSDGKSIKRLSYNKDFDAYPHVLNDGSIGFLRWDYQERHFYYPHGLWTIRPDGTGCDMLFKGHVSTGPYSFRDAMPIPGSSKLFGIACGHHSLAEGALALLDPAHGVNTLQGFSYVTPFASDTEGGYGPNLSAVPEGGVRDAVGPGRGGYYHTPWPLSERSVLVGYDYHHPNSCAFGIYYVDVFGNKELIHRDRLYELAHPLAIKARPRPPMMPDVTQKGINYATCYINDVYEGLPGVNRGAVKYIRILNRTNWVYEKTPVGELRWMPDQGSSWVFGYWTWSPTRVIGTVPVEEDGSAHFKVPVQLALTFQALDEYRMEVRRMRSHVEFQPGEVRGCNGCHETRASTPQWQYSGQRGLAARREPSMPVPPPWGDRVLIDFAKHVQPVLTRNCVSCHGETNPKGQLDFTAREDAWGFTQAYRTMFGIMPGAPLPAGDPKWFKQVFPDMKVAEITKEWCKLVEENKAPGQLVSISNRRGDAEVSMPYQFGSHKSKVITALFDANHKDAVKMSPQEWETLVTWVDVNAPYSGRMWIKHDPASGAKLKRPRQVEMEYASPWEPGELAGNGRAVFAREGKLPHGGQ